MLKQFNKIKILGLITTMFLISCAEEEVLGPASFDNFTGFAAMNNYHSPVFNNTVLHLADNGSIMSHDNTLQVYKYVEQFDDKIIDNSKAIYNARLPKDTEDKFFVVQIIGAGNNKALEFIFDEEVSGGFYWNDKDDINLKRSLKDNISVNQLTFFDLAPKTKYIYSKDDSYINLLQSGTIVYYYDESVVVFDYDSTIPVLEKNQALYKAVEGDNYLGVEVVGEGDDKDLRFYFDKKNNNESLFWDGRGSIAFNENDANVDIFPKTFVDNARKYGYQSALEDKGVNLHDNGTIMNSTDTKALFTYSSQPSFANNTEAIYKEVNSGKLVGVKTVGQDHNDRKLEIYFKNSNGIAGFWDRAEDVKHIDNDISMLATRLVGMEGSTPKVITADSSKLPTDGTQLSTLIVDNVTYVLSQKGNNATLWYTTDTTDNPEWDSTTNTGVTVKSSSLQSIGKDLFATVIIGGNIELLKLKPGLAPLSSTDGSSYINEKNSKAIAATSLVTTADNDILYVASSNGTNTTVSRKEKDSTDLRPFGATHGIKIVKSAVLSEDTIYTAGLSDGKVEVFSTMFLYAGSDPITGTGLPASGANISLVYAGNNLYAAVTVNGLTDIYMYSLNNGIHTWTKQTLPGISGIALRDIQLISKGDNIYFLYKNNSQLVVTPLRITESGSLSSFAGGEMTSIKIDISNLNMIAGVTIVDNSMKIDPINADPFLANPDKFLPTGDIYLTYVSSGNKLEVIKINMEDHGVFLLP